MMILPTHDEASSSPPSPSSATCTSSSASVCSEKNLDNIQVASPQHLRCTFPSAGTTSTVDWVCCDDDHGNKTWKNNHGPKSSSLHQKFVHRDTECIRKRRRNENGSGGRSGTRNRSRSISLESSAISCLPQHQRFQRQSQRQFHCTFNRSFVSSIAVAVLSFVAILSQGRTYAFSPSSSSFTFLHPIHHFRHDHSHNHPKTVVSTSTLTLHARSSAKAKRSASLSPSSSTTTKTTKTMDEGDTLVQAVQPLTSSSKEKRMSVQRAWEKAQLLDDPSSLSSADFDESSLSSTPFLDLFTDAGIASVQKMSSSSSLTTNTSQNIKPRNRPSSVPGAMSRQTMMTINEIQTRSRSSSYNNSNGRNSNTINGRNVNANGRGLNENGTTSTLVDPFYSNGSFNTASSSSISPSLATGATTSNGKIESSTSTLTSTPTSPSSILKGISKKAKKKASRGRGRPRKDKGNNASIDEITSIAAEATSSSSSSLLSGSSKIKPKSKKLSPSNSNASSSEALSATSTEADHELSGQRGSSKPIKSSSTESEMNKENKSSKRRSRRGELRTLRPNSSKKMKDSEREGGTTGMMMQGNSKGSSNGAGGGKGGKDGEPPNLQRYYRTELLTPQEEYTLGMKIQFMIICEQVHEGLYEKFGRVPTIEEWAYACGFKEEDNPQQNMQTPYVNQIRPIKNDGFDPVEDANMFVGNGLVNASGPGRGRGRAKKRPPSKLVDYYDDSDIKFEPDFKIKAKSLKPINRGTPMQFVNLMVKSKEAKQRMVQCNMRLVVSISKRYKHVGVNIADLVQEGSIGLTRAAEKFDPKKGFKFSTYASWWIQQAVFRSIAYHSRTIRLPVHVHNLLNRTRRVRLELQRILGRAPTNEEMATELGMTIEKYNKMIRLTRKAISLDMAKYQNNPKDIGQESETSLGDTIDASEVIRDENSPEQSVDRVLFRDDLKEMLKILGEDERAVIYARYGIKDGLTRTVTTVAAQMGQSRSWVRSQECRALRKLRRPWYEKRLWEHQNSLNG